MRCARIIFAISKLGIIVCIGCVAAALPVVFWENGIMGAEPRELHELVAEVKRVGGDIVSADARMKGRIDDIEKSVNELFKRVARPGQEIVPNEGDERKDAAELCCIKHALVIPKNDGNSAEYVPSASEIDEAILHKKAIRSLFRHGDQNRLSAEFRKSLTSFSLGANDFVLPPQLSNRVLSCLVDPTDLTGLVANAATSGGSLKFFIDNMRMADAAWACEVACFPNNPQPDLQQGLGELEIKVETLRYIVCASSDLLQDAAFDIESWIMRKAADGFRRTISNAIVNGDGIGKPQGLLNPQSGIPILDTSPSTPPGQFTWQDVVLLKYELPMQWHAGASYLMNQRTFGLLLTMSDGINRPLWGQLPGGQPGFMLAGSPITIVSQMPDARPGATPVLFANLQELYTLVTRRAMTMLTDPYSAGFCTLFKFSARIGGGLLCSNAGRLLRIQ